MEEREVFRGAVSPGEDERDEAGGAGGGEIDGGVSDVGHFFGWEIPGPDDLEGGGGVGLFGEFLTVALNGIEEVGRENGFDDFDSVEVGLVGEDGHGDILLGEFLKEFHHAGIGVGSGFPVARIVVLEASHDFGMVVGEGVAEGAADELVDAVSDEALDRIFGMSGEVEIGKSVVESRRNAGEGIDEGAVEIKDESANHEGEVARWEQFSEPCFDRSGRFWK